jgi:hypothetical protein
MCFYESKLILENTIKPKLRTDRRKQSKTFISNYK